MENFIEVLSKKLNVRSQDWIQGVDQYQTVRVPEDGAFSSNIYTAHNKDGLVYELKHSEYIIQFLYLKYKKVFRGVVDPQIELSVIQANIPGYGVGTKVMKEILATADEVNMPVKVVPAPLHPEDVLLYGGTAVTLQRDWDVIVRLRKYYSRLGFKATKKSNAVMHYHPSKVTRELVA